jgi:hypothetical protein
MALLPAKRVLIREIQRLHAGRAPLNISAVKRSHPKLIARVCAVRPFWGWKRSLEDAGLSYAGINTELRDYVDCKICGRDFGALPYHLISQHQVSPADYRREYPEAELVSETVRAGIAQRRLRHRPTLPQWESIWTPEYVLDRIAELHRRKFPLNFDWAKEHEKALNAQAILHFGSWDEALRRIGLDPAQIRLFRPTWRGRSQWMNADKRAIIAELRCRNVAGESISWKTILPTKAGPALLVRAKKVFGSWGGALAAAGLDPFNGARAPWSEANKADILGEIERRQRAGESVRHTEVVAGKWGQPLVKRAGDLFGSWNAALFTAGIEPEAGYSHWPMADRGAILAELRQRKRVGESLRSSRVAKEKWGRALRDRAEKLFGSWNAALRAAGIEPLKENSPWGRASEDAILAEIRRRERAGESFQTTKVEREKWGSPLMNRVRVLFGSWTVALLKAGVQLPPGLTSPWIKADRAVILSEIRGRARASESLRYSKVAAEPWGTALLKRAETLFDSWNAALLAAGVEPPDAVVSPWPTASKAAILREIRRRMRAGKSVRFTDIQQEKWGKPLLRRGGTLFSSWNATLLAAGIEAVKADSPWQKADQAAILVEIRRRNSAGQTLSSKEIGRERWGRPLLRRGATLFGSWNDALLAAGVDRLHLPVRKRWSKADKVAVLAEIHRRKSAGESLRSSEVAKSDAPFLGRARALFDSWKAALLAAGINLNPRPS